MEQYIDLSTVHDFTVYAFIDFFFWGVGVLRKSYIIFRGV